MHEEISIPELTEVVARLSALLGPREGGVMPLLGGITNRNFRVNFGGTDYVVRLPGKRTELLGIDRDAERIATKAAAELGIAPRVAAMLESPSCLVTAFIHGRRLSADELREPATVGGRGQEPARVPRLGHLAADHVRPLRPGRALRRGSPGEHGAEPPDGLRRRPHVRARDQGSRSTVRPATSRCPATTTCSGRTSWPLTTAST